MPESLRPVGRRARHGRSVRAVLGAVTVATLVMFTALATSGCASLPPPEGRTPSQALADTGDTVLGRAATRLAAPHASGLTGALPLENPLDAFAVRVLLARAAERSIDAQYFIWHGDTVGMLLWQALWQAAERGVRVRVLLDDANTSGLDELLAALDAHPTLEVRLYNPFVDRHSRALGYLGDFTRLNRRMHNKSFTVDNQVTVVGGRNIADEYFGAADGLGFADLDVMAIGPVVQQASRQFDLYWNSASAYAAAAFVGPAPADPAAWLQPRFDAVQHGAHAERYLQAVGRAPFVEQLLEHRLVFGWSTAQVINDDPAKTLDTAERSDLLLFPVLVRSMGTPQQQLDIVSPYFVPGETGTAMLVELARSGVQLRVLTNSLASSDESVVHAGYMKRRHDLLRAGVHLYELKPGAADSSLRVRGRFGPAKVSGLHAKTYGVDGQRLFVGSFNFDQRSAKLNTEMGLVLDSPAAAGRLNTVFVDEVPDIAYEVRLAADGQNLQWLERGAGGQLTVYDADPQTTLWQRVRVGFLAGLPIDWLL